MKIMGKMNADMLSQNPKIWELWSFMKWVVVSLKQTKASTSLHSRQGPAADTCCHGRFQRQTASVGSKALMPIFWQVYREFLKGLSWDSPSNIPNPTVMDAGKVWEDGPQNVARLMCAPQTAARADAGRDRAGCLAVTQQGTSSVPIRACPMQ